MFFKPKFSNLTKYNIMSGQQITFQLQGGSFTGASGLTFKKGDVFTSEEPLDKMFPNKFVRIVAGSMVNILSADKRVVEQLSINPVGGSVNSSVQPAESGQTHKVATDAVVDGTVSHVEPVMTPGNVTIANEVPRDATDVTTQFISAELSASHNILVWRLPSGGFAVTNRADRKFLTPNILGSRAGVQEFIVQRTEAGA